jgi:hypothetical protein
MVRRLQPGLTGQELENAQLQVAVDMAMLTAALVGSFEASMVERMWEHRLNARCGAHYVDKELNRVDCGMFNSRPAAEKLLLRATRVNSRSAKRWSFIARLDN